MNQIIGRNLGLLVATILLSSAHRGCLVSPGGLPGTQGRSAPPEPTSPEATVRLVAWCWDHRDFDHYARIFSDDYRFVFASADSSGNAFRDHALRRGDELVAAHHLFVIGTATLPPARRIKVDLERDLFALPDTRPGRNATWHRVVESRARLAVQAGDLDYRVEDTSRFFLVRGDSALIPPDLAAQGFRPDTSRWYVERWEEEDTPPGLLRSRGLRSPTPLATQPTRNLTWGFLKALYR